MSARSPRTLDEILLLSLLAVLAGAEGFTDIARFGQKKLAAAALPAVRQRHAEPRSPRRHFRHARRSGFPTMLVAWVSALIKAPVVLIAIDGRTSRRSGKKGAKDAIHMVSAFAARQRLVLAQTKVGE